jgi:hypothetical protein
MGGECKRLEQFKYQDLVLQIEIYTVMVSFQS